MPIERQGLGKLFEVHQKNKKQKKQSEQTQTKILDRYLAPVYENPRLQFYLGSLALTTIGLIWTKRRFHKRKELYIKSKGNNPLSSTEILTAFQSPIHQPDPANIGPDRLVTPSMYYEIARTNRMNNP